jgi:hypothetical protein
VPDDRRDLLTVVAYMTAALEALLEPTGQEAGYINDNLHQGSQVTESHGAQRKNYRVDTRNALVAVLRFDSRADVESEGGRDIAGYPEGLTSPIRQGVVSRRRHSDTHPHAAGE